MFNIFCCCVYHFKGDKIKLLIEDYEKAAQYVLPLGFKSDFLDLEVEDVQLRKVIQERKELVKKLVKEKAANQTGWLFKLGLQVANQRIVTIVCQVMMEEVRKLKLNARKQSLVGNVVNMSPTCHNVG